MSAYYLNDLAGVLNNINYKEHVVAFESGLVYPLLSHYPAYIDFEKLVEEEVKMNMIKGYNHELKIHRDIEYYDTFCLSDDGYFRSFVMTYSSCKLFKIVHGRIVLRHMYVEKLYRFIKKQYPRLVDSVAQIIFDEVQEMEDKSIYWLFDKEPFYISEMSVCDTYKVEYRSRQILAFQETIGDALCLDVKCLILDFVTEDLVGNNLETLENVEEYNSSDSE